MKLRRFGAAVLPLLAALACTQQQPSQEPSNPEAITNRPKSYDRFIAILKLKTPPLATGGAVDPERKAQLLAEQETVKAELAALSPEIKVLYAYKFALNGLAVVGPRALEEQFRKLTSVAYVERSTSFERLAPVTVSNERSEQTDLETRNSVTFIGGHKVRDELGIDGRGVTVGVIDTGIDYTHAMFGGAGTADAFAANDPNAVEGGSFPTARVVGGVDLVGTAFNAASPDFDQHVPLPDNDPLDEGGHGTHVAGTIAGLGDGVNTYTGVAPGAHLHAIKVFGKDGSTNDAVIIQSFEYAADPNGDLDPSDRLDVVNLSLGSGFGTPHVLYSEAVANVVKGGTVVVASAGNSGAQPYIVGSPSTSNEALSVAASIDDMDHNWKFRAVRFSTPDDASILSEAVEAGFSTPIADAGDVTGKLVPIGFADQDLTPEQKAALAGNVALIDRGLVPFIDKARRAAEAGAIGVVVANNVDGDPFAMGGDGVVQAPAIMISKTLGNTLKATINAGGEARVAFNTPERIEKPQLIDTLTGFSSRGPRSVDGAIKPEVAAPGANVISAKMGGGNTGVKFSGTSMAAPHVAGVAALVRQARADLSASAVKAVLVSTATPTDDANGVQYPVAYAGAGRVNAFEAATTKFVVEPSALSLGEVPVETGKVVTRRVTLTNKTAEAATVKVSSDLAEGLTLTVPASVTVPVNGSATLDLRIRIAPQALSDAKELDGRIVLEGLGEALRIPVLAVVSRTSRVKAEALVVHATSAADAAGAAATLTLVNEGQTPGEALVFNYLGGDTRKEGSQANEARGSVCDLESAGYRFLNGKLEIAAKLYKPVTSWHLCEVSVLVDADGDGEADQELLGTYLQTLTDNAAHVNQFASALTDAGTMRQIRADFERNFPAQDTAVYTPAILDTQAFKAYQHSTVAIVTADLAKLAKTPNGDVRVKIVALAEISTPEADDYLGSETKWRTLTPAEASQPYVGFPESTVLAAGAKADVQLTKGGASGDLVVYFPYNRISLSDTQRDAQAKVLKPAYRP